MINKNKKLPLLTLVLSFAFLLFVKGGMVDASRLNFAVYPSIPENQRDPSHTYFDLRMKPEQEQSIVVVLTNDTENDVVVIPTINPATTNIAGNVDYGKSNEQLDDTAPYDITDLVIPESEEVTVPSKGSVEYKMNIKMPKKEFKGFLAGGITFKEKEDETKDTSEEQGMAIENKYAYTVAILLSESDEAVESKLELLKVEPGQVNARNVINATLQNPQPKYLNQVEIEAKISKKGSKTVLYENKQEEMQMAPNTSFAYPVSLNGEKLKAGKYTLDMTVSTKKDSWHFTKDFEIKAEEAKKLNKTDVSIKKDYTWVIILVVVLLLVVIIGLLVFVRVLMKKNKEKE